MGRLQRWEVTEVWGWRGDPRVHLLRYSAVSDRWYTLCSMPATAPDPPTSPAPDETVDCPQCWKEAARRDIATRDRRPVPESDAIHRVHVGPPTGDVVDLSPIPFLLRPMAQRAVDAGWVVDWPRTDDEAVVLTDRYGCVLLLDEDGGRYRDELGRDTDLFDPAEVERAILHLGPPYP